MKIVMLTGSPHKKGTTDVLASCYLSGAVEKGHRITRFEISQMNLMPCIACDHCRRNPAQCIQQDDMSKIYPSILEADRLVLVTPLYYFGMTAQIKTALDRLYAINSSLLEEPKELELLAACADTDDWAMDALVSHFHAVARYLKWHAKTPLLAYGCATREDIEQTDFPAKAKELGRN